MSEAPGNDAGCSLPDELKRNISGDLQCVTPLAAPLQRSVLIAVVVAALSCAALALVGLRFDIGDLPTWLSWGCTILGLLFGLALAGLALRESVPGGALPFGVVALLILCGIAFHLLVGYLTWKLDPINVRVPLENGYVCFAHEILLAIPALLVTLWLISKALPTRAAVSGALGAAGAAITADSITHLQCSVSDIGHVLVWHTGAIIVFVVLGTLLGSIANQRKS